MPSPSRAKAAALRRRQAPGFRLPVFILAGGASGEDASSNAAASRLIVSSFSGISGTLISGGTTSGIAGVAGEVAAAHPGMVALGYLPRKLPAGVKRDRRYAGFRTTPTDEFSVAECLAYWEDLVEAGVDPAEVRLLGWGGGSIAALEYRIAGAIGARVGLVAGSGRAADALARDAAWSRAANLRFLACERRKVRAFLAAP
jgi:hypothetical protein